MVEIINAVIGKKNDYLAWKSMLDLTLAKSLARIIHKYY